MNRIRQICATTLLVMVFAASTALAGDMPLGVTSTPPSTTETSATGNMPTGATSTSSSSEASLTGDMPQGVTSGTDPVTELALGLLQGVLALF